MERVHQFEVLQKRLKVMETRKKVSRNTISHFHHL
jgi:hypothetical protein